MMASTQLKSCLDKFDGFTQKPVNYLVVQDGIKDDIKTLVKSLYDFTKSEETSKKKKKGGSALAELIVDDFDEEQIWQQIELQNSGCWDKLVWEVANCMSSKNDLQFPVDVKEAQEPEIEEDSSNSASEEEKVDSEQENVESENEHEQPQKSTKKPKGSIVDDKFFKLKDMEKFLINEEKKESGKKVAEADSDEESIDLFEEDDEESDDEEGGKDVMYTDFFDKVDGDEGVIEEAENYNEDVDEDEQFDSDESESRPPKPEKKKVKFAGLSSDDDDSDDSMQEEASKVNQKPHSDEKKSEFEERQQRLQQTIARLEEKSLKEAPWQLKGEVNAMKRPQNSLLEEVVDFDLTSRPPPLITEQTTLTLEDIIKQRVKDKAWDDVEKKEKPVDDQLNFRKTEIIDQSKSKLSLAQVYEAEYLKQKQALSGEVEEEKEPESHTEIRDSMSKLFAKLDALCNYHYTPKAPQAEVKIVSNIPAISMEEVAPVATSDAALLAPEEVKKKQKGDLISKEERSQTDRNRERRKKKKLQRLKGKVMKVTEHRNTKKAVESNNDKSLKTSKAFFQQLNDEAGSLIKSKKAKSTDKTKG